MNGPSLEAAQAEVAYRQEQCRRSARPSRQLFAAGKIWVKRWGRVVRWDPRGAHPTRVEAER